jgi:hypothetical protein
VRYQLNCRCSLCRHKSHNLKIPGFVAAVAIGASALTSQAPRTEVSVIVDADALVANAETTARLREHALAEVERYGHAVYFELNANAIRPVPADEADSFRRAVLPFQPSSYNGVSLTFAEAIEILRKNEAVRETVIRRECPMSGDCGGDVHAAAIAMVNDTEVASARKLGHVAQIARQRIATSVVLVTAGWAYRDERILNLDAIGRDLRASGTRLVVLRVPARIAYEGLVKDACERVASGVSGTFIALNDEGDIARIRRALAGGSQAAGYPRAAVPRVTADPSAAGPDENTSTSTTLDASLRRAAEYVTHFVATFSAVIWRERYQQEDRLPRKFTASGTSFSTLAAERQLESDLLLVWLPKDASWIAVRDVVAIDGKPRSPGDRQLPALLSGQAVSVDQLKTLAAENGRFNIGGIVHTFNEPTLALLFLDEHYRNRFTFARNGEQLLKGQRATRYDFVERGRPTIIQNRDRDVPVRGTLWIDAATGRVLQTSLELSDPSGRLQGRMTVRYGAHSRFDVLVPLEMREWYTSPSGEELTTVATYADFRRFETAGRLIVPR